MNRPKWHRRFGYGCCQGLCGAKLVKPKNPYVWPMSAVSDLTDSACSTVEGLQSDLDMARAPRQKQIGMA